MKSSELRRWLEQQETLHGDLDVACMTADGHVPDERLLTLENLTVTTADRLFVNELQAVKDAKVIAIGYGSDL